MEVITAVYKNHSFILEDNVKLEEGAEYTIRILKKTSIKEKNKQELFDMIEKTPLKLPEGYKFNRNEIYDRQNNSSITKRGNDNEKKY